MRTNLLKRQIRKYLPELSEDELLKMENFLSAVDDAYVSHEVDRELMERSLDISSEEMRLKNESLSEKSESNKKIIANLLDVVKELDSTEFDQESIEAYELSKYLKQLIHTDIQQKNKILAHEREVEEINTDLQKFKLAVDNASDFISILNENNKILYTNQAFLDYCGYTTDELYGKKMAEVVRIKEDQDELQVMLRSIAKNKKPFTKNLKSLKKDGTIFISEVSFTPILNKKGDLELYLLIERDITKELEVDAMKDEFLSIASHELRTPMTVVKGYSDILASERFGKMNADQKKYLGRIDKNILGLIDIVNDMLDISRLESGKISLHYDEFDISELLQNDIFECFNDLCQKKNITLIIKSEPLIVESDSEKIKQVLTNLIGNAYKFTEEGGKIEVGLNLIGKSGFKISVKDNGIGISTANSTNIFKKFYQVENHLQKKEEGTGLGLPISKTIIESLGGEIRAEENPDETGSIFSFTLDIQGS